MSGTIRYQPESARGTTGISSSVPSVKIPNPRRMMLLGRRPPAFFPATSATPNMLSESGARDRPASIAVYSSTICR
jgi:hypothetical protein